MDEKNVDIVLLQKQIDLEMDEATEIVDDTPESETLPLNPEYLKEDEEDLEEAVLMGD